MLFCEVAGRGKKDFDDLAVTLGQLAALGVEAGVHVGSVPQGLNRHLRYELAPHLVDRFPASEDAVLLIGAQQIAGGPMVRLRRLVGEEPLRCHAFGRFATRQDVIGTTARLSYVFGRDPEVFDLAATGEEGGERAPVFGVSKAPRDAAEPPRLLLVAPPLADPTTAAALIALGLSRRVAVTVLADGQSKQDWIAAHGPDAVAIYQHGEVLPASLAARIDICACFAPLQRFLRVQCLTANLAVSGAALIDASEGHALAQSRDAFIRGPVDVANLGQFVTSEILPNLAAIGAQVRDSRFAARCDPAPVLRFLGGEPAPARTPRRRAGRGRVVFMPTNGIGLGHAQRCALVAAELERPRFEPVFAAFPSCLGLIKSRGFDAMPLVSRSAEHARPYANDLANYVRMRALAEGAGTLVFDGGFVFDSVARTILEGGLRGVWIRRGLWQADKDLSLSLDREKVFDRVIVPGEAFEELNRAYSRGERLREVGPIVQQVPAGLDRAAIRRSLADRYGREIMHLVVTQLGGGIATDRSAQIQALCGMMERRPGTLHLVLVWPGAVLQPAWFGWTNTRIVRTRHAVLLAAAADLCVTAAGYNSFHEVLYNAMPAIFLPQTRSFLDDQHARARAAAERGLAGLVEPHELVRLEREIGRWLDGGEAEAARSRLAALDLPRPGIGDAAHLIAEIGDGHGRAGRPAPAHLAARRR